MVGAVPDLVHLERRDDGVAVVTLDHPKVNALSSALLHQLRDVARVLLEGAPQDMSLDELRDHMCGVEGVVAVHDLHAWTITSRSRVGSRLPLWATQFSVVDWSRGIL